MEDNKRILKKAAGLAAVLALAMLLEAGCGMSVKDKSDKAGEKVDIKTPMGNLRVRTNDLAMKDTGMAIYPGATRRPENTSRNTDHDNDSANVDINTPWFSLKVVALHFESNDPPSRVVEFYRKELSRFGKVIECAGGLTVKVEKSSDRELNCKDSHPGSAGEMELKAGTHDKQHIVAMKPQGNGTRFDLVFVQTHSGDTI